MGVYFASKLLVQMPGMENYSRYTIRSTTFGGVELKKDFPDFVCRELNRGHCNDGCGVERSLEILVIKIGIGSKGWCEKVIFRGRSA